jgi:hypothetical protein
MYSSHPQPWISLINPKARDGVWMVLREREREREREGERDSEDPICKLDLDARFGRS